jgi:hypothetical protein
MKDWKAAVRTWKQRNKKTAEPNQQKTKLFPIPGKSCYKCRMPAVYKDTSGTYDSYTCCEHMPEKVKKFYCG